jgi:hypothetical protein
MFTAKADTIDDNLAALEEIASALFKQGSDLDIEVHRLWVDLSEGIADLRGETVADGCNCDECECENLDEYTEENGTCEECFRDCQVTECDCSEVCGWHKPHTVAEGETVCSNCGTPTQYGEESYIEFECETHGDVSWSR